ncbi:MAG: sigma-70 family RNA polymerase sigma factor [Planctomycetota bacterium]
MSGEAETRVTQLLGAIRAGDPAARDELLPVVYEELRSLARGRMAAEAPGHTLQTTALVHEAYLRLLGQGDASWENRRHFYGAASEAMRRILVEHARRRQTRKRGGDRRRVDLEMIGGVFDAEPADTLSLDKSLEELKQRDGRMYDIAMLRHFCGLTNEETARALDISPRTVRREWGYARLWLRKAMRGDSSTAEDGADRFD